MQFDSSDKNITIGAVAAFISGKLRIMSGKVATRLVDFLSHKNEARLAQIVLDTLHYLEQLTKSPESADEEEFIQEFIIIAVWSVGGRMILNDRVLIASENPNTNTLELFEEEYSIEE